MQSKRQSIIESAVNIVAGIVIAFTITQIMSMIPGTGVKVELISNIYLTLLITGASIIRHYAVRRYFNNKLKRRLKDDI